MNQCVNPACRLLIDPAAGHCPHCGTKQASYAPFIFEAPPNTAPGLWGSDPAFPVARISTRFKASLLDNTLVAVAFYWYALALAPVVGGRHPVTGTAFSIAVALAVLYGPLMESSPLQGTVGKCLLGVKVVGLGGDRIGFGRALLRGLAKWGGALLCGSEITWFAFALGSRRSQALHDLAARTLVVPRRAAPGIGS